MYWYFQNVEQKCISQKNIEKCQSHCAYEAHIGYTHDCKEPWRSRFHENALYIENVTVILYAMMCTHGRQYIIYEIAKYSGGRRDEKLIKTSYRNFTDGNQLENERALLCVMRRVPIVMGRRRTVKKAITVNGTDRTPPIPSRIYIYVRTREVSSVCLGWQRSWAECGCTRREPGDKEENAANLNADEMTYVRGSQWSSSGWDCREGIGNDDEHIIIIRERQLASMTAAICVRVNSKTRIQVGVCVCVFSFSFKWCES